MMMLDKLDEYTKTHRYRMNTHELINYRKELITSLRLTDEVINKRKRA